MIKGTNVMWESQTGGAKSATWLSDKPSKKDERAEESAYQKILDTALAATGATVVSLSRYDNNTGLVHTVAVSGLDSAPAKQTLLLVKCLFPQFDPESLSFNFNANSLIEKVYAKGESVYAMFHEVSKGLVDDFVIRMYSRVMGIDYSFICPLKVGSKVVGSLSFYTSRPMDKGNRVMCEVFGDQAALTLEKYFILETLNTQLKALQDSRNRVALAEERVRKDISEMLHGRVQTRLLMAWHQLGRCLEMMDKDHEEAKAILKDIRKDIDQVREQEIREASHLLHPSIIQVGLIPAVKSLVRRFEGSTKISLNYDGKIDELDKVTMNLIPEPVRLAAYRIVEEGLNNVLKHAGATTVDVSFKVASRQRLQITICDNGRGFNQDKLKTGFGLASIEDRVERLGGSWDISSSLGFGTTLSVYLPLN